ncbi:NupC/NupG family nucleoside CNT transporter [Asticcacaulis sp. AND118]|uniref:NupC/NupG family nucleoside CNT transporter n=1 Tax=Asticcacaulis sp. AND118 TaxID=2840468 RepID=UPI001CFF7EC5|nr:nucleoside transporter C-terminal domain-containing protein [Asticcacaulis sp. AND118]UDF03029.1 NupC/NupG family nucleoside CNT transporter [Asticcacaulis sp. AND118]
MPILTPELSQILRALCGLVVFIGMVWLLSENRRAFPMRAVLTGLIAQIGLAVLLTRLPPLTAALGAVAHAVDAVQSAAVQGAIFVFGYLGGGAQPFVRAEGGASTFIFALQALPALLLVSALAALLWHVGVLRWIVRGAAWGFGRVFGVSGPVGVSVSACIFLGMIESPLLVRPLLPKLTRGELFILMVDGMSVVAGSMMILLGAMMSRHMPDAFTHLLIASLISTPMAIGLARILVPDAGSGQLLALDLRSPYRSGMDALTQGTLSAVHMAVNIAALLIVFIGLIALVNMGLKAAPIGPEPLTLGRILGWLFTPVAWLMGAPATDLQTVGSLLGAKVSMNEVVAYGQLSALPTEALTPKGLLIATYALCSFGNIGSVAILIGTLSALVPERADEFVELGFKALFCAFLTSCMTGSVIGLVSTLP